MISPLLRRREFRTFWLGQSVSLFGDEITLFAVPITAVLLLHARVGQMGLLTAAGLLPSLLLSIHAGAWVDRVGRRRVIMLCCDLVRATVLVSVPLAYLAGVLVLGQLYVVAVLVGVCDVFFGVSDQSLFVTMVPEQEYVAGQALLNGSRAAAFVGGTGVAGLLVTLFTAPGAILADAVTFVASALCLSRIRPREPAPAAKEPGQLWVGLRFIRDSPILRPELLSTTTVNLFTFAINAVFILYATSELHVRPAELGLVLAAGGVGSLIASPLSGPIARRMGTGPMFALGSLLFSAMFVFVPLAAGPHWLVLAALVTAEFGASFGVMLLDIGAGALNAATIPNHLRARVSGAFRMINYGIRPVGALLGGALGSWIGLRPTLWVAVIGAVLCVVPLLGSPVLHPNRSTRSDADVLTGTA